MTLFESTAAALCLVSVALTVRQSLWCWPTGIVMVSMYAVFYWRQRLYAQSVLQLFFFVLQVYGWWEWLHGGAGGGKLAVRKARADEAALLFVLGGAGTGAIGLLLSRSTDSPLPYWDAGILAFSLVAQWMLAQKTLENWPLWACIDVATVSVCLRLKLYPTATLFAILFGIATTGFFAWRRDMKRAPDLSGAPREGNGRSGCPRDAVDSPLRGEGVRGQPAERVPPGR